MCRCSNSMLPVCAQLRASGSGARCAVPSGMELDDRILTALSKTTPTRFSDLHVGTDSRATDRALQRLRKAGRIRYVPGAGSGWVLV